MDARENGHEIIETLMADAAGLLGRQEHRSWKYYTMIEVLAAFCRDYAGTDPTSGQGA